MKNVDWQSSVLIMIICFILCMGLHKFTKVVDRYADQHYQAKAKVKK